MHIVTVQDADNEVVDVFVVDTSYHPYLYDELDKRLKAKGLRLEVVQSVETLDVEAAKWRLASQCDDT